MQHSTRYANPSGRRTYATPRPDSFYLGIVSHRAGQAFVTHIHGDGAAQNELSPGELMIDGIGQHRTAGIGLAAWEVKFGSKIGPVSKPGNVFPEAARFIVLIGYSSTADCSPCGASSLVRATSGARCPASLRQSRRPWRVPAPLPPGWRVAPPRSARCTPHLAVIAVAAPVRPDDETVVWGEDAAELIVRLLEQAGVEVHTLRTAGCDRVVGSALSRAVIDDGAGSVSLDARDVPLIVAEESDKKTAREVNHVHVGCSFRAGTIA